MLTLLAPFGALVWAGGTVLLAVLPFYVIERETGISVFEKVLHAGFFLAVFLGGLYYTIGGFQIFFFELRERFIAHKATYRDGVFLLKGYYFKQASFHANEVVSVEPLLVSERWFQKRLGTLLSRSTRFTIPHGKNVNLKISLRDGRTFYLPGEMGRPGQWKDEDVKELRDFMEACAARASHPDRPSA
ncbi:MAG: hypothetical protein Q8Q28_12165 [Pseudomonadota bacterium]|nr:hypothetical protein [Pseudomonadota bacterium]